MYIYNRLTHSQNTRLLTLAVILGLFCGVVVYLFRRTIDLFHELFNGFLTENILAPLLGVFGGVVALAIGGLIVGMIMQRFIGHERHHGAAGIMEAVALAGGRLRYRRMPFKALASAISLGAGASIGPEDPSVQIGANLGSWIGQRLDISEDHMRLLVAAGAASAIAAAFKAPFAGVFFALEVILNSAFETRSFGVIVLAAVVSSAVTQAVDPAAEIGPLTYTLGSPLEIPLFIPLGIILALVAALFIRAIDWQHHLWNEQIHLSLPVKTALAGVILGLVGIAFPQVLGIGRESINGILSGEIAYPFLLLIALGLLKIIMTALSVEAGFVGGVFAPTLFVGTMLGSAYGQVLNRFLPTVLTSDVQTYGIAGMAATLAGVVRCPITAILLVFELTNDYRLILPIMLSTVVCVIVVEQIEPFGIYVRGLKRKGVHLPQGSEIDLLQTVRVLDVMRTPAPTISENASLIDLRDTLRREQVRTLSVIDAEGQLIGVVTLSDLQRAFQPGNNTFASRISPDSYPVVGSICTRKLITVVADEGLQSAVRLLETHNIAGVPVVDPNTGTLVGLFNRHGIVRAYKLALERKTSDKKMAQQVRLHHLTSLEVYQFRVEQGAPLADHRIVEVKFPAQTVVVAVERGGHAFTPNGSTLINVGDWVTFVAPHGAGEAIREVTTSVT